MRREQAVEKRPYDHRGGGGGGGGGGWELPHNHPLGQPFPAYSYDKVRQLYYLPIKAALDFAAPAPAPAPAPSSSS